MLYWYISKNTDAAGAVQEGFATQLTTCSQVERERERERERVRGLCDAADRICTGELHAAVRVARLVC